MVSVIYDKFEINIANKIVSYMIHPAAEALSEYVDLQYLLCFDTDHSWFDWNSIMNYQHHGGITYFVIHDGGGWCSGIVRWGGWWVWKRFREDEISYFNLR